MATWIDEELATLDLGDDLLNRRQKSVRRRFADRPRASIPGACRGWAETQGAYRFFSHPRVTAEAVLQPHCDATIRRIEEHPVVLLPQDTTELDFTRPQKRIQGAGPLNWERRIGFFQHVQLAVTPERLPLGVVAVTTWGRDPEDHRKTDRRKQMPIEQKESYRLMQGYRRACAVAQQVPSTQIISISDREGDIYECFVEAAEASGPRADWIIRALPGPQPAGTIRRDPGVRQALGDGGRDRAPGPTPGPVAALGSGPGAGGDLDDARRTGGPEAAPAGGPQPARGVGQRGVGPRGEPTAGRRADRVAAVDGPARGDVRGRLPGGELLLLPLAGGGLLPHLQERLPRRGDRVGDRGAAEALPVVVPDRGLAGAVADDAGSDEPGVAVRPGVRGGGMAPGLDDRARAARSRVGTVAERDDRSGGLPGWSSGAHPGRPTRPAGVVDRDPADEGFRSGLASLRTSTC